MRSIIRMLAVTVTTAGALSLAAYAAPPTTVSHAGVVLKSVNEAIPFTFDQFPGGDEADAINAHCLSCHSKGMILTQPRYSEAFWKAEVEKMRTAFKAPITDKDIPPIVAYLVKIRGPK